MKDLHAVGVIAVITDGEGRVLLTRRRDNGDWEPPGGGLERDEDIITGLRREVREETGLEVTQPVLTSVYKNMRRIVVSLTFWCTIASGELTANSEVTEFRWVTADEAAKLCCEAFIMRVTDAMNIHDRPAVRQHDGFTIIQ
jgi:8-oxo-dGTP diphosphatase